MCLAMAKGALSQTLGGNAVFNFLRQSNTSQLSALGGINVSNLSTDVGLTFHNPALLRPEMHAAASASFNHLFAGVNNYSLTSAYHASNAATTFAAGVNFFDYGSLTQTDAAGNIAGTFKPNDYVVQVMASRKHKANWYYGTTIKFISSTYGQFKSNGIAADVALTFVDTARFLQIGLVVKNIGTQLKTYNSSTAKEELPFDLQAGISKRLEKAPLQFSLTAHHLHRFNIRYNDTTFLAGEDITTYQSEKPFFTKVFSHLIFATQFFVGDIIEVTAGYNFVRRTELNVLTATNGMNGFSAGAGLLLKELQVRYATGFYQRNMFNQVSVNFRY